MPSLASPHVFAPPAPAGAEAGLRHRRKEARPQQLLDAALELFVQKGYAATRAEEVAARAGVAKGTLYLYYRSKEELLKAVIRDRLSSRIRLGALAADEHPGSAAEVLRSIVAPWWLAVVESPASGVFKLVVNEARSVPEIAECYRAEVVEPGQQLIGRILRRGIEAGEFRPVDVEATVQSLVLPMVMLCLHRHSVGACAAGEAVDAGRFIEHHIDLVLRGLRPDDGAPAGASPPRRPRPHR